MDNTAPARFLLLVPPAEAHDFASWKSTYETTISEVLKEVVLHSEESTSRAAVLEIAFACPHLVGTSQQPRSTLYAQTQQALAQLYKLVVIIAARDNINIEDPSGVDVRIVLVAWSHADELSNEETYLAPVVSLATLARSNRPWQYAFGVETATGEAMVRAFVTAKANAQPSSDANHDLKISEKVPQTSATPAAPTTQQGRHSSVAVGGTFDHLHIGHKLLLTMTLFTVDVQPNSSVIIGLTGDELLKNKKYAEVLESWQTRQEVIQDFCDSMLDFTSWPASKNVTSRDNPVPNGKSVDYEYNLGLTIRCTQIQDPFGPTITDQNISALVLSAETRSGGDAINKRRAEKGWASLEVFEVDVLDADEPGTIKEGFEAKLSSTAIRQKLASQDK